MKMMKICPHENLEEEKAAFIDLMKSSSGQLIDYHLDELASNCTDTLDRFKSREGEEIIEKALAMTELCPSPETRFKCYKNMKELISYTKRFTRNDLLMDSLLKAAYKITPDLPEDQLRKLRYSFLI